MTCKICGTHYEKPIESGRISWPVCSLECLQKYRKWKMDKNQQRQEAAARANHRRMMRAMAKAYQKEMF